MSHKESQMDKIIAKVTKNQQVRLISPEQVAGRSAFKIMNSGNISQFPIGSEVEINLVKSPSKGEKIAVIEKLYKKAELPVVDNVVELPRRVDKDYSNLSQFKKGLHFYLVFNPLFNQDDNELYEGKTQAHSFFNLLKNKHKDDSSSYLYWGKIKSTEGREGLCPEKYQSVVKNNTDNGQESYLFISDFSYFWVAKVEEVDFEVSKSEINNHSLEFYKNNYNRVEAWFKVTDMTLLSNTSKETIKLVSDLQISRNNEFNSRIDKDKDIEVTPYLSGLRYPLIIEDKKVEKYFSNDLETQKENPLLDKDKSLTNKTKAHISGYVIPQEVFECLSTSVQREIISAEIEYSNLNCNSVKDIYAKDLCVARKYLLILEKVINDMLMKIEFPRNSRVILSKKDNITLGQIQHLLLDREFDFLKSQNKRAFFALKSLLKNGKMNMFTQVRNMNVHITDEVVSHDVLINIRREILGVGKLGYINSFTASVNPEVKGMFNFDGYLKTA